MSNPEWDNYSGYPTIVTLCGSTRFKKEYEEAQLQETLAGKIVLTVGGYLHSDERVKKLMHVKDCECGTKDVIVDDGTFWRDVRCLKTKVDELHLRKIDLSDEILVLNVDGYIGESTKREIAHARAKGKRIRYLTGNIVEEIPRG